MNKTNKSVIYFHVGTIDEIKFPQTPPILFISHNCEF